MAGDWIKMETATPDKPEVWAIAESLDLDPDAVFGKLFRIWSWFDEHTEKGNAPSVTKKLLNRLVGVTGFCEEVIKAGWMLEDEGMLVLPNFDRHNGKTAKNRALTAKRVQKSKAKSNDSGNDMVTVDALPREEKRREDIHRVFSTWRSVMESPMAKLTNDRKTKILARLSEGYTAEDLEKAIRGCATSEYHMGDNPQKRKYNSIELIFRNGEKLETFRAMAEGDSEPEAFV